MRLSIARVYPQVIGGLPKQVFLDDFGVLTVGSSSEHIQRLESVGTKQYNQSELWQAPKTLGIKLCVKHISPTMGTKTNAFEQSLSAASSHL